MNLEFRCRENAVAMPICPSDDLTSSKALPAPINLDSSLLTGGHLIAADLTQEELAAEQQRKRADRLSARAATLPTLPTRSSVVE